MIYAGPLDEATDTANRAVYGMSRTVTAAAPDAAPADAASAGYKLAASLDYIAAALTALRDGQSAATEDEAAALALAAGKAAEAAQCARNGAQVGLDRHQATTGEG
ncbi:hypothetical protein [Arthrobacter castelli]|uniref:hypothetical protein n=1 Tax=Arthrobacter castelli TaxID=271431 RepID=UPI000412A282|nr:hypothetical protein [Arthrobacter castelli]